MSISYPKWRRTTHIVSWIQTGQKRVTLLGPGSSESFVTLNLNFSASRPAIVTWISLMGKGYEECQYKWRVWVGNVNETHTQGSQLNMITSKKAPSFVLASRADRDVRIESIGWSSDGISIGKLVLVMYITLIRRRTTYHLEQWPPPPSALWPTESHIRPCLPHSTRKYHDHVILHRFSRSSVEYATILSPLTCSAFGGCQAYKKAWRIPKSSTYEEHSGQGGNKIRRMLNQGGIDIWK